MSIDQAPPSLLSRLRNPRTIIPLIIALGIVVVGVKHAPIDWSNAWKDIRQANFGLYLMAFGVLVLSFVIRGIRWRLLLENAGEKLPLIPLANIIVVSFFVNCVVPAKMGDLYRAYLLRQKEQVGGTRAFGTIIAERLLDLVVLMTMLIVAGAISFHNHVPEQLIPYFIGGIILSLLGIALLVLMQMGRGTRVLRRLPQHLVERYEHFRAGTVESLAHYPSLILLTVLVWTLEATRLGFVVFALHYGNLVGPPQFLLIALIAALLTTVPFLPGGIGLVEAGMITVLVLIGGLHNDAAAAIALLDRSLSYGAIVLIGFVFFTVIQLRLPHATQLPEVKTSI